MSRLKIQTRQYLREKMTSDSFRLKEMEWLKEHRHEYIGEWVVIDRSLLIAHGHNGREVYEKAVETGIEVPFLIHILNEGELLPFGGW